MARSTLGANMSSNTPPIPPAPSQAVEICTIDAPPRGETVNVVTALEPVSDSVRTRPGSGSATSSGTPGTPACPHFELPDRASTHATGFHPEA
jgi:hypothetical protein